MGRRTPATASTGGPPPSDEAAPTRTMVGALIRVVARRGYVVEGVCLDVWRLRHGGTALKIRPTDGSTVREITTLEPIVVLLGSDRHAS